MSDSKEIVGERLVLTRKLLGISQGELCTSLGISPGTWSPFETGKRMITVRAAGKLRAKYGVPLDWIYCGDSSGLSNRLIQKLPPAA